MMVQRCLLCASHQVAHATLLEAWRCCETGMYDKDVDRWRKRQMEDELRDPRNFVECVPDLMTLLCCVAAIWHACYTLQH